MLYTDLLPYVLPSCPACPDGMATQCIRLSAIELFKRANLWWNEFSLVSVANQATYSLGTPSGITELAEVKKVESLKVGDTLYSLATVGYATEMSDADTDLDLAYTNDARSVTLQPAPTDAGLAIKVRAWLIPSLSSTQIPDAPATQYVEALASGALARVLMLPQPWRDPVAAAAYADKFNTSAGKAALVAARGRSKFNGRVKAHYF